MRVARRKAAVLVRVTRSPHADSQPRPGRGLAVDHFIGQAEIRRQLPDFKFEQTSQGLDYRDLELRREAADIVVGFGSSLTR